MRLLGNVLLAKRWARFRCWAVGSWHRHSQSTVASCRTFPDVGNFAAAFASLKKHKFYSNFARKDITVILVKVSEFYGKKKEINKNMYFSMP